MSNPPFTDRADATARLAKAVSAYRGTHPLVLGIPRGGVPMAKRMAQALAGDVDVVLVRKIGAPGEPEFAIGAVDESGRVSMNPEAAGLAIPARYVEQEAARQLETIRRRRAEYTRHRVPIDPAGRTVIVVDDGLATGATMIAALRALRDRRPARLVCAIPVAPPETVAAVRRECDDVICLLAPAEFRAVGQFYAQFDQVSDADVIAALDEDS